MTPLFPIIEYNLPGFPADRYGFTQAERLHWSYLTIEYLLNDQGIEFLADLRFPEGQYLPADSCKNANPNSCKSLFSDKELTHFKDVKNVTSKVWRVWRFSVLAGIFTGILLYSKKYRSAIQIAVLMGARITVLIYLGLLIYILFNFDLLFDQFHELFFADGTWTFRGSDTLIRLFPLRFWQDAFIFVGGASVLEAIGLGIWVYRAQLKGRGSH